MYRIVGFMLFVSFVAATTAKAEDPQIILESNSAQAHVPWAKIVDAADKICRIARAHDVFDDFGTQQECIENSTQNLVVRQVHPTDRRVATNTAP